MPDHGIGARFGGRSSHRPSWRQRRSWGDGAEGAVRQLAPPSAGSSVEETLEESLRGGHPANPCGLRDAPHNPEQPCRDVGQGLGVLH